MTFKDCLENEDIRTALTIFLGELRGHGKNKFKKCLDVLQSQEFFEQTKYLNPTNFLAVETAIEVVESAISILEAVEKSDKNEKNTIANGGN